MFIITCFGGTLRSHNFFSEACLGDNAPLRFQSFLCYEKRTTNQRSLNFSVKSISGVDVIFIFQILEFDKSYNMHIVKVKIFDGFKHNNTILFCIVDHWMTYIYIYLQNRQYNP